MKRRKPEDADRTAVPTSVRTPARGEAPEMSPARRAASEVLLGVSDRILTLVALALIAPAGVFLTIAWIYGPQVGVHAAQYRHFTQRTDAWIIESWLAFDAALAALVNTVTVQVGAMDETGRVELFTRLKQDKEVDLKGAGMVFLPAAKVALLDSAGGVPVRRAAKEFLSAWFTMPTETFDKYSLGYQERLRLDAQMADVR